MEIEISRSRQHLEEPLINITMALGRGTWTAQSTFLQIIKLAPDICLPPRDTPQKKQSGTTGELMKVLLTGIDGYIGSVLAPILENSGHDVVGAELVVSDGRVM